MTSECLMLLDTASLYFRAHYRVPDSITAPDGTPVNAFRFSKSALQFVCPHIGMRTRGSPA